MISNFTSQSFSPRFGKTVVPESCLYSDPRSNASSFERQYGPLVEELDNHGIDILFECGHAGSGDDDGGHRFSFIENTTKHVIHRVTHMTGGTSAFIPEVAEEARKLLTNIKP